MKNKLIVALDMKGLDNVFSLVNKLGDDALWYKVGAVNFTAYSYKLIDFIHSKNKKLFLDLKYHDIPNTVKESVYSACEIGVDMMSIHSIGGVDMMMAANDAVKEYEDKYSKKGPKILAVTVLTSSTKETIKRDMFLDIEVQDMVLKLAENAKNAGIRGLVASPKETTLLREHFGDYFTIVTPGIRPKDSAKNDQKRVTAPHDAIKMGSDYIVVGRPIYASENPIESFSSIIKEMEEAC
jgi:orotidine-5'-phosphate decarboxylase